MLLDVPLIDEFVRLDEVVDDDDVPTSEMVISQRPHIKRVDVGQRDLVL